MPRPRSISNISNHDPSLSRSYATHAPIRSLALAPAPTLSQVQLKQQQQQQQHGPHAVAAGNDVLVYMQKPHLRALKLAGHTADVNDIDMHGSGKQLASASNDHTIRLWEISVRGTSQLLRGHTAPVRSVQYSYGQQQLLLSSGDDKVAKIWNINSGRFQASLKGHTNWVRRARWSPDNRIVATGGDDKLVKLFEVETQAVVHTFAHHQQPVLDVAFHPSGTLLATSSADATINLYDTRTQAIVQHYTAHDASINSIAFHPNGNYLISGSDDQSIKIWDVLQGHQLYTIHGHKGAVNAVRFDSTGYQFASGSDDRNFLIWDANFFDEHSSRLTDIAAKSAIRPVSASGRRPRSSAPGSQQLISQAAELTEKPHNSALLSEQQYNDNPTEHGSKLSSQPHTYTHVHYDPFRRKEHEYTENAGAEYSAVTVNQPYDGGQYAAPVQASSKLTQPQHIEISPPINARERLPEEMGGILSQMADQMRVILSSMETFEARMTTFERKLVNIEETQVQLSRSLNKS